MNHLTAAAPAHPCAHRTWASAVQGCTSVAAGKDAVSDRSPHLGIRRAWMHKCRQRQDAESGLPGGVKSFIGQRGVAEKASGSACPARNRR